MLGVPYNYMVPGYENGRVNTLRLWSAQATHAFDLEIFNSGDYAEAVRAQTFAENISKVLYPEDSTPAGQGAAAAAAVLLRRLLAARLPRPGAAATASTCTSCPSAIIFQLNDTHPVIAIPELMRILVDEKGWDWDDAWAVTQQCFAYTCHTLLPEALEVWPVDLLGRLLPRHLEIIYRINDEFLAELRDAYPDDELRVRRMSIIAEYPVRAVRMAYLATVAGTKVNGVAELHSQLLRDKVLERLLRVLPGQVHQRDQRRHAAPVRPARQPRAVGPDHRGDRRRLGHRPRPAARASSRWPTTPEFRRRFREIKRATSTGSPTCWPTATASS